MTAPALAGPEAAPKTGQVKRLVIFLHGLGADGNDLLALSEMLDLPDTQYLSPHAPFPFDMAPFGRQWFTLTDHSPAKMLTGAQTAAPILDAYLTAQMERFHLAAKDIALVGFSQGTMMALYTGLRRKEPLAGIVGFSGALLGPELLAAELQSRTPVCLIHGEADPVVPFFAHGLAEAALKNAQVPHEAHARPGLGHSIDEQGMAIATAFLRKCFGLN